MEPLTVEKLNLRYTPDGPPAVDDLCFSVHDDEILALVGPSGCGKTSTLRVIAGLERSHSGTIRVRDRIIESPSVYVPPEERRIGIVFQELALFPHMDVLANVMFGLSGAPKAERKRLAMEALDRVGLADLARRKPHELSGGQQQRVALARSLAPAPPIILLDEPFSGLDAGLRDQARQDIRDLLKANGMAALLVTHDQEEALSFADRIGVMRDGHICQMDVPERIYQNPSCPFVAQFLGQTNLINAQVTVDGEHIDTPVGPMCLSCPSTGEVTVSVRPEHLTLVPPADGQPVGRVTSRQFKGHDLTIGVTIGGHDLVVQADYACPFQVGQEVSLVHTEAAVVVEPDDALRQASQ